MTLLVTGGTGTLGRPTVAALRAAGHAPRMLCRRSDARATRNLVDAARAAGVQHLVYLSIVGVDAGPLG